MRSPRLLKALRICGLGLLGLLGLVGGLIATAALIVQTGWGQRKLLAEVLPILNKALTGHVEIGSIGGNLLHRLVLRDVRVYDSEAELAASVQEAALRYNLFALIHCEVHITHLRLDGSQVHARYLRNGQINLAALVKPTPPSGPLPVRITVDDIIVELGANFAPKPGTDIPPAQVQLHLEAALRLVDPHVTAELKRLKIQVQAPLTAEVELSGGLSVVRGAQPQIEARKLALVVRTTGQQVNLLVPQAELTGGFELAMTLAGPLTGLGMDGTLRLPKGTLALRGSVGVLDPRLPWQIQLDGQGIDPAAARKGIPEANIDLQVAGHGQGARGRIDLRKLVVRSLGADFSASGFADGNAQQELGFPLPKGISAELAFNLRAPDLSRQTELFVAPSLKLAGAVEAGAKIVTDQGQLRIDLNAQGKNLQAAGNSVERLTLELHSVDLLGQLKLHADSLNSPLRLTRLDLDAGMSEHALSVRALGVYASKLVFQLAVAGQPHLAGQKLLGLEASLNQLFLTRAGQRLALVAPARIALDLQPASGPIFDVGQVALLLDQQRLTVAGHFEAKPQRFRASLHALAINAKQWAQLGGLSGFPKTALDLHVQASGTPKNPTGQVRLSGRIESLPERHLPRSELQLAVNVQSQRARGELSIKFDQPQPTEPPTPPVVLAQPVPSAERPSANLRFDVPFSRTGPLTVELDAQSLAQSFSELLPVPARSLRGHLSLHAGLRGTLQQPELVLTLKVPDWSFHKLSGRSTAVQLSYGHELADLRVNSELATGSAIPIATIALGAQMRIKLGLGAGRLPTPAQFQHQLLQSAMWVDASVVHIDLPEMIAAIAPDQAADPTVVAGKLSATLHVEGTPQAPSVKLKVDAQELATEVPNLKNLAVGVIANYTGRDLKLDVSADLPEQQLIKLHAETVLPMERVLAGTLNLNQLPLLATTLDVLPFELSRISNIHGQMTAQAKVQGTVGTPEVTAWVRSKRVQIENFAIGPLAIRASLDHERTLKADVEAQQAGGSLRLTGSSQVPPRLETVQLHLAAQNFHVDYNPTPGTIRLRNPLGMVKGILNADIRVQGRQDGPTVRGFLKLEQGGLVMKALRQALTNINIDLQVTPPVEGSSRTVIALREARWNADTGKASVNGEVVFEGVKLSQVSLDAEAQKFPVWAGVMGLWIDSKVQISGHVNGDTLNVDVHIPEGAVRLPKLQSARSVQALGPFEDVRFVDRAAQQAAEQLRKREEKKDQAAAERKAAPQQSLAFLPLHTRITVQLPDALHVTGPEVRADLSGRIDLAMDSGGVPHITGQIRNTESFGWVEILKHRYEIDRVETSFGGEMPPNPLLNIQISRKLDDATIYITVNGTAKQPKISFRSEPPILDESQIIAVILTGQQGRSADVHAMGILSSLLIGQLANQLTDRLPIDVLRVDVAGDDPMGVNQSSLEVGKYLRENVYLGYKRVFGGATTGLQRLNADQVILEYNFYRAYKLKALYGDANVGAIDLYWSKRF